MNGEGGGTRRLALGLVLAVLVAIGGGIVLSGWADDGAQPETVGAISQPAGRAVTTTIPSAADAAPTTGPSTTEAARAPATSPTTRAAAATTTSTAALRQVSSTTSTTPGPGTASDGAPGPACTATMFDTRLTLERATYRHGETVRGTATFTNVSGNTCWWASSTGKTEVLDPTGRSVNVAAVLIRDGFHWIPFTPGEVFTTTPTWDQQACPPDGLPMPCGQAPPGAYTMVVTEQPYGVARATFQLVAA